MDGRRQALKNDFADAFRALRLSSNRAREHWLHRLAVLTSTLAGPVYSIVENGGCAYVYMRQDEFFRDIDDPASLYGRLRQWHDQMAAAVQQFAPGSPPESADLAVMRESIGAMWAVTEAAWTIERDRWEASAQC